MTQTQINILLILFILVLFSVGALAEINNASHSCMITDKDNKKLECDLDNMDSKCLSVLLYKLNKE